MLSDLPFVLVSVRNIQYDHPLLVDTFNVCSTLACYSKDIVFTWVLGHVGIRGNTTVELAAKHAHGKRVNKRVVPYTDFKVMTSEYRKQLWQTERERYLENKSFNTLLTKYIQLSYLPSIK